MNIRTVQIEDHPALVEFWKKIPGLGLEGWDNQVKFGKYLKHNGPLSFLAEDQSGIIGSCLAGHDGWRGFLRHVGVAKEYQRKGIASKLIKKSLDALKQIGIERFYIYIIKTNEEGKNFWGHMGWERCVDEFEIMRISCSGTVLNAESDCANTAVSTDC